MTNQSTTLALANLRDEMLRQRLRERRKFIEACCARLQCSEQDLFGMVENLTKLIEEATEADEKLEGENQFLQGRVKELEQEVADLTQLNETLEFDCADLEKDIAGHNTCHRSLLEEAGQEVRYERD